jgi:hypothetical protein
VQPAPADPSLIDKLRLAIAGEPVPGGAPARPGRPRRRPLPWLRLSPRPAGPPDGLDWNMLFESVTGAPAPPAARAGGGRRRRS